MVCILSDNIRNTVVFGTAITEFSQW